MTAWWPLDETSGTTAADIAGFPNNGNHVNGPIPTPGKVAGALRFDGVDDHVWVPDHADLNVGTGNFTLDAWVRTQASSGVVVLVDKRNGPTPRGYSLFLVNGRLGFQMANGVGSSTCAPAPTTGVACVNYGGVGPLVADGQWHHVAAVVDRGDPNTGVRLYVDGVQVFAGAPVVAPSLPDNLDNTSDLYLGMRTPGMGGGAFFRGDLDEVELFKQALTQAEIQAIYAADSAGKCKTPTATPTVTATSTPTCPAGTGSITVSKTTMCCLPNATQFVSTSQGFNFDIVATGGAAPLDQQFVLDTDPASQPPQSLTFRCLPVGTYVIREAEPSGWGLIGMSGSPSSCCVFGPGNNAVTVNLTAGTQVQVGFQNVSVGTFTPTASHTATRTPTRTPTPFGGPTG